MGLVALERHVGFIEGEDVAPRREAQGGEGQRLAGQLQLRLVEVVQIEVRIAQGMDELARLEAGRAQIESERAAAGSAGGSESR